MSKGKRSGGNKPLTETRYKKYGNQRAAAQTHHLKKYGDQRAAAQTHHLRKYGDQRAAAQTHHLKKYGNQRAAAQAHYINKYGDQRAAAQTNYMLGRLTRECGIWVLESPIFWVIFVALIAGTHFGWHCIAVSAGWVVAFRNVAGNATNVGLEPLMRIGVPILITLADFCVCMLGGIVYCQFNEPPAPRRRRR